MFVGKRTFLETAEKEGQIGEFLGIQAQGRADGRQTRAAAVQIDALEIYIGRRTCRIWSLVGFKH